MIHTIVVRFINYIGHHFCIGLYYSPVMTTSTSKIYNKENLHCTVIYARITMLHICLLLQIKVFYLK